jgi:hypothetical protein
VWTAEPGEPGVIRLPVDPANLPVAVRLGFDAQLSPKMPEETFTVTLGGGAARTLKSSLADGTGTDQQATLPLDAAAQARMRADGHLTIEVRAPDARSNRMLGLDDGARLLGFGLRSLTLLAPL